MVVKKKGEGPNPKAAFGDKKTPLFLVPTIPLKMIAWVMKNGAVKYGPFNWRKTKVNASTYISATHRHFHAWVEGENIDKESGLHHLAHVAANIFILLDAILTKSLIDDRPKIQKRSDKFEEGADGLFRETKNRR